MTDHPPQFSRQPRLVARGALSDAAVSSGSPAAVPQVLMSLDHKLPSRWNPLSYIKLHQC